MIKKIFDNPNSITWITLLIIIIMIIPSFQSFLKDEQNRAMELTRIQDTQNSHSESLIILKQRINQEDNTLFNIQLLLQKIALREGISKP